MLWYALKSHLSWRNPYKVGPMQALSEASLEDVNSLWAGLGYYRRARFLLEGAQYVVQHHSGSFPKTSKELQKIPGDTLGIFSPHYHAQQSGMSWRSMPIPYEYSRFAWVCPHHNCPQYRYSKGCLE